MLIGNKICVITLILSLICECLVCGRDYYDILGVSKKATTKEIKRAYRKIAKECHPDKNPSEENKNLFKAASTAHEVLVDEQKRRVYDQHGEEGLKEHMSQQGSGGHGSHNSFFDDGVFSFFFGGGQRQRGDRGHGKQTGATIKMELFVTLEELYNGEFIEFLRSQPTKKESSGKRRCRCRMETVTKSLGPGSYQMLQQEVCDECSAIQIVTEEHMHEIEVETGMKVDEELPPFTLMGEPHIEGDNGDLIFVIKQIRHVLFHRIKNNLYMNLSISLKDALFGFNSTISHLDRHPVKISSTKLTVPGQIIKVPNEGMIMKDGRSRGDLFVTIDVVFPKKVDSQFLPDIEKIFSESSTLPIAYNSL